MEEKEKVKITFEDNKFEDNKISIEDLINEIEKIYWKLYNKKIAKTTKTFICKLILLYFYYPEYINKNELVNGKHLIEYSFENNENFKECFYILNDEYRKYYTKEISVFDDSKVPIKDNKSSDFRLNEEIIINLMLNNLSTNGFLKTSYDKTLLTNYLDSLNLLIVDEKFEENWYKNYKEKESKIDIFESLKECYRLDLFLRIEKVNIKKNEKEEIKKYFISLPDDKFCKIYNNIRENKIDIKEIKENARRKEIHLVTIRLYSSNFFNEIKEILKVENSNFQEKWKIARRITNWNNRFLLIFAICFVLSTLFFEVFQALAIWNETLSKEKLIYIGFCFLTVMIIIGFILLVSYIINRKYIRSYNFNSNVEYKSLAQKKFLLF
ncbi:hypothetical protein VO56_01270 [Mycoplasmopsis gallinacea]|uniref:Uncharacterized protein n=1 Tax=Mycoplasmopsis gallinacea TaxID=29556 RepID=A0A0D5ZJB6_9BACT|nr:hypothetical protein VO56_01270 [Mycoplasmopsis gallinacea]